MDSLTIGLKIEGKDKKFTAPNFIPGKLFREAAEISGDIESGDNKRMDLDKHIQFVCNVFGNKFDADQFENGIDARKLTRTIYATTHFVVGNISGASKLLAENAEEVGDLKN